MYDCSRRITLSCSKMFAFFSLSPGIPGSKSPTLGSSDEDGQLDDSLQDKIEANDDSKVKASIEETTTGLAVGDNESVVEYEGIPEGANITQIVEGSEYLMYHARSSGHKHRSWE